MANPEFSVIDQLLKGDSVELKGEGTVRLQADQLGKPFAPPAGPGSVKFKVGYSPEQMAPGANHTHALKVWLEGTDEVGKQILKQRKESDLTPLGRYDLEGTVAVAGSQCQVRLDTISVDHRSAANWRMFFAPDDARSLICVPEAPSDWDAVGTSLDGGELR